MDTQPTHRFAEKNPPNPTSHYKACTPRKVLTTVSTLTPRATPPSAMLPGQCLITKAYNGTIVNVLAATDEDARPLTPPSTPDIGLHQHSMMG